LSYAVVAVFGGTIGLVLGSVATLFIEHNDVLKLLGDLGP